jgi:hypothetical protein
MSRRSKRLISAEPQTTPAEDRATALVNRIIDEHEWTACGLEMCATLKRELIAAVAAELAKEAALQHTRNC